jgi:hypothetical protein
MAFARFERTSAPAGYVQFSRNPSNASKDPIEYLAPQDWSNGGTLYSCNKGLVRRTFELTWSGMSDADYQSLVTFFETVAVVSRYSFTFTDWNGSTFTVKFLTRKLDFPFVGNGRRSGQLTLLRV